ncbi:MAG: hypothetical protein JWM86_1980 [Thermoleophilia bacterium]|nr:hypothetical protein [Thermoleophilia bacterium]
MTAAPRPTAAVPPIRRPRTVAGPAYVGDVTPQAPWGAWLEAPAGGSMAVQLAWGDGPQPTVRLSDAAGSWWTPDQQPDAPSHTAWIELAPGWTWISVECSFVERQAVRVATWLPVQDQPVGH